MIINGSLPATFPLVFENLLAQSGGEGGGVRVERGARHGEGGVGRDHGNGDEAREADVVTII